MIQGDTASVRLSEIIIRREDRLRREIKTEKIEALAESISRLGLIHFPVLSRDMVLVSGETRVAAMLALGWDRTNIVWADTLDEKELLSIELEENCKRTDLTWQEQCNAVRRYHKLQQDLQTKWSVANTAEALGLSLGTTSEYIQIAEAVASGDERVRAAPLLSTAKNIVKRAAERRRSDESALMGIINGDINDLAAPASPILNEDFRDWVVGYDGPPFNLLHCDFPYGIDADKFNQSAGAELGRYRDSFDTYATLVQTLIENKEKLLGDSAHIIFWFSMQHYDYTLRTLRPHFRVDPYPLVWIKSDNRGTLPDPNRGPRRIYEVAFLCSHGDRKIVTPTANAFSSPTARTGEHMSEKSQEMLEYFFKMVVDNGTRLLDPTAGSGSALRAADKLGASSVLGLELDPEFAANACRAWERRYG